MSIRKTGSAEDTAIAVEGGDDRLDSDNNSTFFKQGSATWADADEQGLAAENDTADQQD